MVDKEDGSDTRRSQTIDEGNFRSRRPTANKIVTSNLIIFDQLLFSRFTFQAKLSECALRHFTSHPFANSTPYTLARLSAV